MSVPFRVKAAFSSNAVLHDAPDPIRLVSEGQIELRHIDCAGGRCALADATWVDREGHDHRGKLIQCTVCGDSSVARPIESLVQQIRLAVLDGKSSSYGGWVDMDGDPELGEGSKSGTSKPVKLILEAEIVRIHFADGGTRDMMAARYILRHGVNNQTYLYDAEGREVAVYAPGIVRAIEAIRAYPKGDA